MVKKVLLSLLVGFVGLFFSVKTASAGRLYTVPTQIQTYVGVQQEITLYIDTQNQSINAAQVNLTSSSDGLSILSITGLDSLPIAAQEQIDGNTLRMARGSIEPVKGDVAFAKVLLKPKRAGTYSLSFDPDSALVAFLDSTNILTQTQGTSVIAQDIYGRRKTQEATTSAENTKLLKRILDALRRLLSQSPPSI